MAAVATAAATLVAPMLAHFIVWAFTMASTTAILVASGNQQGQACGGIKEPFALHDRDRESVGRFPLATRATGIS